jgi:hypothetical protein
MIKHEFRQDIVVHTIHYSKENNESYAFVPCSVSCSNLLTENFVYCLLLLISPYFMHRSVVYGIHYTIYGICTADDFTIVLYWTVKLNAVQGCGTGFGFGIRISDPDPQLWLNVPVWIATCCEHRLVIFMVSYILQTSLFSTLIAKSINRFIWNF